MIEQKCDFQPDNYCVEQYREKRHQQIAQDFVPELSGEIRKQSRNQCCGGSDDRVNIAGGIHSEESAQKIGQAAAERQSGDCQGGKGGQNGQAFADPELYRPISNGCDRKGQDDINRGDHRDFDHVAGLFACVFHFQGSFFRSFLYSQEVATDLYLKSTFQIITKSRGNYKAEKKKSAETSSFLPIFGYKTE